MAQPSTVITRQSLAPGVPVRMLVIAALIAAFAAAITWAPGVEGPPVAASATVEAWKQDAATRKHQQSVLPTVDAWKQDAVTRQFHQLGG